MAAYNSCQTRPRRWIVIACGFEHDRLLPADLQLRGKQQAPKRAGQRGENPEEKQRAIVHDFTPALADEIPPQYSAQNDRQIGSREHGSNAYRGIAQ